MEDAAFSSLAFSDCDQGFLHLGAKLANDEGNLFDWLTANFDDVFYKSLYNRFASDWDQRFWNGEGMWAHTFAHSSHRDDDLHKINR
jgi:hypothetical protein